MDREVICSVEELIAEVSVYLENNKKEISRKASDRMHSEVKSYSEGFVPKTECVEVNERLIDFLIRYLDVYKKCEEPEKDETESFHELVKIEEGIAAKRVRYQIPLTDLLRAINILRETIWSELRIFFESKKSFPASMYFDLEYKINNFIFSSLIKISGYFLGTAENILDHQENMLQKWEEVVKSVYHLSLKIPCRAKFVAIPRLQAEAIAKRLKYSEEEVQDIKVAVGEACDNAIEHSNSHDVVYVNYYILKEYLKIVVIDHGKGFEPEGKGEEPPDLFSERGRGIFLMKALLDHVEITSQLDVGTTVELVKKRCITSSKHQK